jgi:hypothetical protein
MHAICASCAYRKVLTLVLKSVPSERFNTQSRCLHTTHAHRCANCNTTHQTLCSGLCVCVWCVCVVCTICMLQLYRQQLDASTCYQRTICSGTHQHWSSVHLEHGNGRVECNTCRAWYVYQQRIQNANTEHGSNCYGITQRPKCVILLSIPYNRYL